MSKRLQYEKLDPYVFVTKLAGFEHTKHIQGVATHQPEADTDIPMVQGKNIRNGFFVQKHEWFISKDVSDALPRSVLDKPCILIPYVGSNLGEVGIFPNDYRCHLASNIAKVAIAAMPLLKGDFSMVYENGSYNVSGLPAGTYQYAFTNRRSMPMFEGSFTVGADGTASVANANPGWTYLAVRTDATENSFASQVRYLTKENAWVADESSRQITTQQEKTSKEELVTYYRNKGLAVLIETAVETVNNLIGTGTTITIMGEEFKAVVHGDLDGDADISTKDLQNATKHVLAEEQLQAEYLDAGCIVGEEETKEMNLFDIYAIINYLETGSFTR